LIVDFGVVALCLESAAGAPLSAPDLVAGFVGLVLFRHDAVGRWRRLSVTICGTLLAGTLIWSCGAVLARSGISSAWTTQPALAWLLPLPGHLLAKAVTVLRPRRPLTLPRGGAWAARAREALRCTPCRWRPVEPSATGAAATLPRGSLAQLDAVLETPSGPIPLAPEGPHDGMGWAVKRTFDLLIVAALLPALLPLTLLLALLVRLRDGAPVFYSQVRITQSGQHFRIHKLRSMVRDAEAGQPVWPEEGDPRITPLGRFLRRFWLDELPQIWDVLRGPLSLVGPRPERPFFVQDFSVRLPNYTLRHQVKAGITGLAQVTGFVGNTSIDRRLHADLRYLRRWSPFLDLTILAATVFKAVKRPAIHLKRGPDPES